MIAALLHSAAPEAVMMTEQHNYTLIREVEFRYHLIKAHPCTTYVLKGCRPSYSSDPNI